MSELNATAPWGLRDYYTAGVINALELSAAERVGELYGERRAPVLIALALAQAATRVGHLALRLSSIAQDFSPEVLRAIADTGRLQDELPLSAAQWLSTEERPTPKVDALSWDQLPPFERWWAMIDESPAVRSVARESDARPFVLDGEMLFTLKSWRGESQVAEALSRLSETSVGALPQPERLWGRLFGPLGSAEQPGEGWFEGEVSAADWGRARIALYTAMRGAVTVLHGGPGTGKTTLTQRILAALFDQYDHPDSTAPLRVALAAPTGKAAQRLTESIQSRAPFFHLPEWIQARLSQLQGQTLHSLLGIAPGRARPQHHPENPLPYDVIVIDEASMVDTWLMRTLTQAMSMSEEGGARRRLLLIGDPNQLPSVSAGAPFTELCGDRGGRSTSDWIIELTQFYESEGAQCPALSAGRGFVDRVVALNQVKRVDDQSGVHRAATFMQRVDELGPEPVLESLLDERYQDTALYSAPPFPKGLFEQVCAHYAESVSLAKIDPQLSLQQLKGLCLLAPHYAGPLGVNELNEAVEESLRGRRLGGWGKAYVGRPVLITQNHPATGLVNGDIGVIGAGRLVYFEGREAGVPLELLPPHRTVYAMSVHKSQGSEFETVIMCVPPTRSPILTRELVYTGLTRAKKVAVVVGSAEVLRASLLAKVERGGQLSARIERRSGG